MATFGLGFSQQEVNRKCRTVLYKDRYKNSRFRSLGKNIVRGMKVVRSMENVGAEAGPGQVGEASRDQAVTLIIGGERDDLEPVWPSHTWKYGNWGIFMYKIIMFPLFY